MLIEKVKQTIERHRMLDDGKVVLGVSGGVDSVVLLDIMRRILPPARLVLAHLNHGIRGKAARADARFVLELGRKLGIPVIAEEADVPRLSSREGLSLEAAGRRARREFLERAARETGATRIALGHTRDDLVETVIWHLIRGTGPTGLAGIRPVRLPYVRPLIDATREEILGYARKHSLSWREDETNKDTRFTRNLIRHRVIPLLAEINPRLPAAVARAAELIQQEERAVAWLIEPVWKRVFRGTDAGKIVLDRAELAALPAEVQGLILRRGIESARGGLAGIEKVHIDGLRRLIASPRAHGELRLPGLYVYMERDLLFLSPKRTETPSFSPVEVKLGRTEVPALGIALTLALRPWEGVERLPETPSAEVADADSVEFPLHLRTRRPGDRFRPLGMPGEKKLKDFLIDQKVPFYTRARVPLLCDRQGIIWVVGIRLAERVKVTPATKNSLLMRVEELS